MTDSDDRAPFLVPVSRWSILMFDTWSIIHCRGKNSKLGNEFHPHFAFNVLVDEFLMGIYCSMEVLSCL